MNNYLKDYSENIKDGKRRWLLRLLQSPAMKISNTRAVFKDFGEQPVVRDFKKMLE